MMPAEGMCSAIAVFADSRAQPANFSAERFDAHLINIVIRVHHTILPTSGGVQHPLVGEWRLLVSAVLLGNTRQSRGGIVAERTRGGLRRRGQLWGI